MSSSYRCKFIKNIPDKQILKAFTGSSRVLWVENKPNILFGLSPKAFVHDYSYFGNSCAFCQTHPCGYCALHCLLYVFGSARQMRRWWTVAISTLILRFSITCSFVFMSNLMAYNSMSNIFTPYNPIFLIPLKVKYKGEPPKTQ